MTTGLIYVNVPNAGCNSSPRGSILSSWRTRSTPTIIFTREEEDGNWIPPNAIFTPFNSSNFERLLGRKGRVLDIGCGNGSFLSFAEEHGWEIAGVDIKLSADARRLTCPLWEGRLQDIDFGEASASMYSPEPRSRAHSKPGRGTCDHPRPLKPGRNRLFERPEYRRDQRALEKCAEPPWPQGPPLASLRRDASSFFLYA